MVVIEQIGCVRAKWVYSGKLVVFGQKWLYSRKRGCIREKVDVFGKIGYIR